MQDVIECSFAELHDRFDRFTILGDHLIRTQRDHDIMDYITDEDLKYDPDTVTLRRVY